MRDFGVLVGMLEPLLDYFCVALCFFHLMLTHREDLFNFTAFTDMFAGSHQVPARHV